MSFNEVWGPNELKRNLCYLCFLSLAHRILCHGQNRLREVKNQWFCTAFGLSLMIFSLAYFLPSNSPFQGMQIFIGSGSFKWISENQTHRIASLIMKILQSAIQIFHYFSLKVNDYYSWNIYQNNIFFKELTCIMCMMYITHF